MGRAGVRREVRSRQEGLRGLQRCTDCRVGCGADIQGAAVVDVTADRFVRVGYHSRHPIPQLWESDVCKPGVQAGPLRANRHMLDRLQKMRGTCDPLPPYQFLLMFLISWRDLGTLALSPGICADICASLLCHCQPAGLPCRW
jgi:hypothetical protein